MGSLLSFMHAVNLRFGPAITPEQWVVYEALYPMVVAARDQIFNQADVKETSSPQAKKVDRFLLGNALGRREIQLGATPQPEQASKLLNPDDNRPHRQANLTGNTWSRGSYDVRARV